MNELSATVRILDRPYRLKVSPANEQYLRDAADLINKQAAQFAKTFAFQDNQDLLSMVALTQITQLMEIRQRNEFRDTKLEAKLEEIDQLLDRC